jgi:hypothetical protein
MRIIRVEHMSLLRGDRPAGPYAEKAWFDAEHGEEGVVCYDADCIHDYIEELTWESGARRPAPWEDGLREPSSAYLFGFRSFDLMRAWFNGDMRKLHAIGYVAAVYDVPGHAAKHGDKQSMFEWEYAKRIGDAPMVSPKQIQALLA